MRLAQARFHFIGIGGIGMCGLAELFHNMGAQVAGSDLSDNNQTQHLKSIGINVQKGHHPNHIGDADVVVYSSAVKIENPEFQEARRRKIPLIPRAEALAEFMRLKRGIAVGGTHGKTTTTSLVASIFLEAKSEPTIVVGGRLDLIQSTARLGSGEWMIAEADESDGSFVRLSPEMAIITNIDNDHMEHFGSFDKLKRAFSEFAGRIPFYGLTVVCGDGSLERDLFKAFNKRILFYGFSEANDLVLHGANGVYDVTYHKKPIGTLNINVPGRHNALNAAAALAVGLEAGFDFATCARGIAAFRGVDRRFQWKGTFQKNVDVFDDYGHHPTEISAVVRAFHEKYPGRRLVVAFQPHRYSRTQLCWEQFKQCFEGIDQLYLCDIYPAGEKPLDGVNSRRLADDIKNIGKVQYLEGAVTGLEQLERIQSELMPGDIFLTLGAGDVFKLGDNLLKK